MKILHIINRYRSFTSTLELSEVVKIGQNFGFYDKFEVPFFLLSPYKANGIFFTVKIMQAIRLLHELGTLQHFENEFLKDKIVINPQWIVDVMACVVSVHETAIKVRKLSIKFFFDLNFFIINTAGWKITAL